MNPGTTNRLLASLPADLQTRLIDESDLVNLKRGEMLMLRGQPFEYVYFPTSSLISLVVSFTSGTTIEAMVVGTDGFVGLPALFNSSVANTDAMVQIAGETLRMELRAFWGHLEDARLRDHLGGFSLLAFGRLAQSTGCVAFHPVEQRLSRWLLLVRDALERSEFPLTQEFLGIMLGVHRPTVTLAVRTLEKAGVIEHSRGHIRITNEQGLLDAACECYMRALRELES